MEKTKIRYLIRLETRLVREKIETNNFTKRTIKTPEDVYNLFISLRDEPQEKFVALHLSSRNHLLNYQVVSIGSANASIVHPREVFKGALLSNAIALIFIHNHPSGDAEPSSDDIRLTKRLSECGNLMGIDVLDHIVVGYENYKSMKELKLM